MGKNSSGAAFLMVAFIFSCPSFAMTLKEAQELALKNNSQLAAFQSETSEYRVKAQVASLSNRPEIGLALGGESDGTFKERENQLLAFGYVNMTLYDGFQSRIRREAAEHQVERSRLAGHWAEQETRRQVEELFLRIAYHMELNKVLNQEVAAFDALKRKALARQKAGFIGEADVAEFEVRQMDLKEDILASELERGSLFGQLSFITRKDGISSIEGYALPNISREKSKAGKEVVNLPMQLLEKDLQSLRFAKEENEARWGPKVEFEARAGRLPSEGDWSSKKERIDALVIAKWNFFNQAQRNAGIQEILEKEKTIAFHRDGERKQVDFQAMDLQTKMATLERKSEIVLKSKAVAERYHRITMNEYERGVKTSSDAAHATEGLFSNAVKGLDLRFEWKQRRLLLEALAPSL